MHGIDGPPVTSIVAAPSQLPRPKYCDLTGLPVRRPPPARPCARGTRGLTSRPASCAASGVRAGMRGAQASYRDPKTGLNFYSAEVYAAVKDMAPARVQQYLALRGAVVKLG